MRVELTALYEYLPGGRVVAYVAEIPEVSVGADSLVTARKKLAEKLQMYLCRERELAVRRAGPQVRAETISVELPELSPHQAKPAGAGPPLERLQPYGEADLIRCLLDRHLIPGALPAVAPDEDFDPVPVQGRPISEEIIEDRR